MLSSLFFIKNTKIRIIQTKCKSGKKRGAGLIFIKQVGLHMYIDQIKFVCIKFLQQFNKQPPNTSMCTDAYIFKCKRNF